MARLIGNFATLGVVAGLVIPIIQVDQANKLIESDAIQRRASEIQEALQPFALSDHLPAIYGKASEQGFGSLGIDEKARMQEWDSARLFRMQGQYQQYQLGLPDQTSAKNMLQEGAWYSKNCWKPLGVPIADQNFVETLNKAKPVQPPGAMEVLERVANPRLGQGCQSITICSGWLLRQCAVLSCGMRQQALNSGVISSNAS